MKKYLLTSLLTLTTIGIAMGQKVNQKVEIELNGVWYAGKILKVNDQAKQYFISFDGREDSSNEWVSADRLKFKKVTGKFKEGDKVEVEYGLVYETGVILEVGENKYHIKFDKTMYGDIWTVEEKIRKL